MSLAPFWTISTQTFTFSNLHNANDDMMMRTNCINARDHFSSSFMRQLRGDFEHLTWIFKLQGKLQGHSAHILIIDLIQAVINFLYNGSCI